MDQNAALFQFRISFGSDSRNLFKFGPGVVGFGFYAEVCQFDPFEKLQRRRFVARNT
jgi:hypothetical protein